MLQGRHVYEGLESRTGLADSHCGAVEAVLAAAADHGQDVAVSRVDGDEGPLRLGQAVFVLVVVRQLSQGFRRGALFFQIHGGVNLQAFLIQGVIAVFGGDELRDVVDEGSRIGIVVGLLHLRQF